MVKDIPEGQYYNLDYDKSYCKNNSKIGDYDNVLVKVSFWFVGTDSCYFYFYEFIKPDLGDSNITMNVSDTKWHLIFIGLVIIVLTWLILKNLQ